VTLRPRAADRMSGGPWCPEPASMIEGGEAVRSRPDGIRPWFRPCVVALFPPPVGAPALTTIRHRGSLSPRRPNSCTQGYAVYRALVTGRVPTSSMIGPGRPISGVPPPNSSPATGRTT